MTSGFVVRLWRPVVAVAVVMVMIMVTVTVEGTYAPPSMAARVFSSRLIHRLSDELRVFSGNKSWPEWKSKEYYHMLLAGDFQRQKMKISHQRQHQLLFPSQGSQTLFFGNELGWLHYTWIDIGTPKVSFLVALDDGSDLLWVPCDCVQCASLSARQYTSLDKDLSQYDPAGSSTSKHLPCSHQLCELGSNCNSPTQPCPYVAQYYSENTSSSGLLVEDVLHFSSSSNNTSNAAVQASVIFGCGKKQSGDYLDGVAPDGLMGLGLGDISVPSLLAKSGLVQDSFSLCFNDDGSGRIFFGDQGLSTHQWTPLLPLHGKYTTYIIGVDALCIGKSSCIKQTSFHALIDSGTSFTFLPANVYKKVVQEFDRQVNASRASFDGYPWKYCYTSSAQETMRYPSVKLMLSSNESLVIQNPIFPVIGDQEIVGYCLAIQPAEGDIAIIGQNYMTGYRMVFDRENMRLGWSHSDCQYLSDGKRMPPAPPGTGNPPNPLPSNEQQSVPGGHAVAPAIAGRAPPKASAATTLRTSFWMLLSRLLFLLTSLHLLCNLEPEIGLDLM